MTVVFDRTTALTGTDDGGGDGNDGNRLVITSLSAGVGGETQFRVTVRFGTACPTESGSITDMFGGRGAPTGNTYNFANSPARVTFSGGNTISGSAAGVVVSDWVALPETYDNTKPFVIAWHVLSTSASSVSLAVVAGQELWFKAGGNPSLQTDTGYSDSGTDAYFVEKIEIQAASSSSSLALSRSDDIPPSKRMVSQDAQTFVPRVLPPPIGISGIGWFAPLDRQMPPARINIEAPPAIALTPVTLPPQISGMAWFEPPDRDRPAARPIDSPPAFAVAPPQVVTWSFSVGDTVWLRDAPIDAPPALGRSFAQPVGISGIGWFAPPDRDRPSVKVTLEAPPALALTPATLPVKISGIGWFAPRDADRPATKVITDHPAAFGRSFAPPVGISGMAWFTPPEWPKPAIRINGEAQPGVVLSPPFQPAGIVGIAWMVQPDRDRPAPKPFDQAPSVTFIPPNLTTWSFTVGDGFFLRDPPVDGPPALGRAQISGPVLSWQVQPERHYLARLNLETAPARAPFAKLAPPVGISGMAWFVPRDQDRPPTRIFDYPPSMGRLLNSVSVLPIIRTPVSGTWSTYQVNGTWSASRVTGRADPGTKP